MRRNEWARSPECAVRRKNCRRGWGARWSITELRSQADDRLDTASKWQGAALRHRRRARRFTWAGVEKVSRMEASPDWRPPKEMIDRQPYLPRFMAGGPGNPLGARALYLGNTVYRIHGTNQPSTIGTFVSSGCIRLTNRTSWTSLHPCPCRHAYCGAGGLGAHHGAAGGSGSRAPPPG
jgi:L,D-transpeptidase catalytic domain